MLLADDWGFPAALTNSWPADSTRLCSDIRQGEASVPHQQLKAAGWAVQPARRRVRRDGRLRSASRVAGWKGGMCTQRRVANTVSNIHTPACLLSVNDLHSPQFCVQGLALDGQPWPTATPPLAADLQPCCVRLQGRRHCCVWRTAVSQGRNARATVLGLG